MYGAEPSHLDYPTAARRAGTGALKNTDGRGAPAAVEPFETDGHRAHPHRVAHDHGRFDHAVTRFADVRAQHGERGSCSGDALHAPRTLGQHRAVQQCRVDLVGDPALSCSRSRAPASTSRMHLARFVTSGSGSGRSERRAGCARKKSSSTRLRPSTCSAESGPRGGGVSVVECCGSDDTWFIGGSLRSGAGKGGPSTPPSGVFGKSLNQWSDNQVHGVRALLRTARACARERLS